MSDPRSLDFRSDNVAGVPPEILAALAAANQGTDSSYGDDAITRRLEAQLADLFEHDVVVFPVATGSAANALALANVVPGWGSILCHREAHIATDECGAPEFYSSGAKLVVLDGTHGKLQASTIDRHLARDIRGVHHVQPMAVSISQSTEAGTCYRPDEIAAIGEICRRHNLKFHMDGARFANAQATLGCTPAEATWRAGIDILSLGLTKNGAMAAEAVVFFDTTLAKNFDYRRKRGGHLFSKMRFVSAQLEAQLTAGLWLRLAEHANRMAGLIAAAIGKIPGVKLLHPVQANELFILMPDVAIAALEAAGHRFYRWEAAEGPCVRLVTAFNTKEDDVEAFIQALTTANFEAE
ncbi:MAG: ltaE [Rhodospirillales bacterium]|nr:ltaE [Rhodospirillales bacterium]